MRSIVSVHMIGIFNTSQVISSTSPIFKHLSSIDFDSQKVNIFSSLISLTKEGTNFSSTKYIPNKWFYGSILSSLDSFLGMRSIIVTLFSWLMRCWVRRNGQSFLYFREDCLGKGINYFSKRLLIEKLALSGNRTKVWTLSLSLKHLTCTLHFLVFKSIISKLKIISCLFLPCLSTPTNRVFIVSFTGTSYFK